MKIVVLGAGHVGYEIAKQLSFEEHDVSVVDNDSNTLKQVTDKLDVRPILGNAVDIDILREAGIEDANVIIAATSSDETNIVSCQIVNFMFGVESKIARINKKSYFEHTNIFDKNKFSIDLIASPDIEISSIIKRSISVSGALDFISCMEDKLKIIGVQCTKNCAFVNIPLKFLSNVSNDVEIAVLFIEKNNTSFIPQKNDVILEGDEVYFAVKSSDVSAALALFGTHNNESNNIVLVGGGNISYEIARSIIQDNTDIAIKIIENDLATAEELSKNLKNTEIIYGDPLDLEILKQSLLPNTEALLAITTDDKSNILLCLLAKTLGIKRVAAMAKEILNVPLFHALGVNAILDPKKAVISKILQYIRKGTSETISTLSDDQTEIFTINVSSNSKAIGVLVDDINSSDKVRIGVLIRFDKIFFMPNRMIINAGDKLLFVSQKNTLSKVTNLFKNKPKYLI